MEKTLSTALCMILVLSAAFAGLDLSGNVEGKSVEATTFAGGSGTVGDPYIITNVWELQNMSLDLSAHYALGNDIDANITGYWNSGAGFEPVGDNANKFMGSLDGRNCTIMDLYINRPLESYVGLFGFVNSGDGITNLTLAEVNITGQDYVGSIVGRTWGPTQLANCSVNGTVSATGDWCGGIIGECVNSGFRIEYCTANVNVTANIGAGGLGGYIAGVAWRCTAIVNVSANIGAAGFAGLITSGTGAVSECHAVGTVQSAGEWAGGFVAQYGDTTTTDTDIEACSFSGTVNGGNKTGGFVGELLCDGLIEGCWVDSDVSGDTNVGGFCGLVDAPTDPPTIRNCTVTSTVNGSAYVGGVVGQGYGDLISISADVAVSSTGDGTWAGGLAGSHGNGTISNCAVEGTVHSDGTLSWLGGLVGNCMGTNISRCRTDVHVTAENGEYMGGLVGILQGSTSLISDSSSSGTVNSLNSSNSIVGGFAGTVRGNIHNCSSSASVSGKSRTGGFTGLIGTGITIEGCSAFGDVTSSGDYTGGFIGSLSQNSDITDCYARGNVSGMNRLGGFAGSLTTGTLDRCYSVGKVTGNTEVGGFVGSMTGGTVATSFWDAESSGTNISSAGTGKTTGEMKDIFTFLGAGWDFVNIWSIKNAFTYPYFGWESANFGPIAHDDSYQASEDTVLTVQAEGVLANDVDYDHDDLSVLACDSMSASGAAISWGADGSFTYDPRGAPAIELLADGDWIIDSFEYTVTDGNGGNDTATVRVNVTGSNDAPEAVNDTATINEDVLLTMAAPGLLANDNDADTGDTLKTVAHAFLTTMGAYVEINADGSFSYDPRNSAILQALAVGEWANDVFQYTLADSSGGADVGQAMVNVTGLNDAPAMAMGTAYETVENTLFTLSCSAEDRDGTDVLAWSLSTNATGLGIAAGTGVLSGTMAAGVYYAQVTVSDGHGGEDSANITLTVLADTDGDGVADRDDDDDDGDGWDDYIEVLAGTDPLNATAFPGDADADGIPDFMDPDFLGYETIVNQTAWNNQTVNQTVYSNNTIWQNSTNNVTVGVSDADTDGDGWTDAEEILAGTDPLDATDKPVDTDGDGIADFMDAQDAETITDTETPMWAWGALVAAIVLGLVAAIAILKGGKKPEEPSETPAQEPQTEKPEP